MDLAKTQCDLNVAYVQTPSYEDYYRQGSEPDYYYPDVSSRSYNYDPESAYYADVQGKRPELAGPVRFK